MYGGFNVHCRIGFDNTNSSVKPGFAIAIPEFSVKPGFAIAIPGFSVKPSFAIFIPGVSLLNQVLRWYTIFCTLSFAKPGITREKPSSVYVVGFYVDFNNFSVISRQYLVAAGSSVLTFIVLPHWNIMSQTLGMIPHPVTLYWHSSSSPSFTL